MCGVAGVMTFRGPPVSAPVLTGMAKAVAHRGPDGERIWIDDTGSVGFAFRRLAIIDPHIRSEQPLHSADGRYTLVFNGEIYNFVELRRELIAAGAVFRSEGDGEVIVEAWRRWGPDAFPRMNGMWALAIHDAETRTLTLCRDRFGVKPLYYTRSGEGLAFASEMRALHATPWADRTPDLQVAERYLFDAFSVEGGEHTLYRAIRRLPAGHWARVKPDGICEVRRWWRTCDHLVRTPSALADQADEFRSLFFDAVRLRMRSDVPISTCLSGGFDSSAVTCALSRIARDDGPHERSASDWRHAFVASFPGVQIDETAYARDAAAFAGIDPHIVPIGDDHALEDIEQVLEDMEDVYIALPTSVWRLHAAIRERGIKVTLAGHGADELMGGYRPERPSLQHHLRDLAGSVDRRLHPASATDLARNLVFNAAGLQHLRRRRAMPPAPLPTPFDRDELPEQWTLFDRRLYRMFHATVLPTILRNFDRMSMAHGVEVRMPFMDWRLVAYVMSLPPAARVQGGMTKFIAREAMRGLMPEQIRASRRKVGFTSPMVEWLNGPAAPWVREVLARDNAAFDEIVDLKALRARVGALNAARAWTWRATEHLWPYVHMKWLFDRTAG